MVALFDGRLSCIHTFYRHMTVLSWVNCSLKSVKFLFLAKYSLQGDAREHISHAMKNLVFKLC